MNVTAGKPAELRFTVSKKSVAKGIVTFKVVNKGALSHDFKIGGKVTTLLKPGTTATLKVTLKAGKAPYLCTVPGHAAAGMKGVIIVKWDASSSPECGGSAALRGAWTNARDARYNPARERGRLMARHDRAGLPA